MAQSKSKTTVAKTKTAPKKNSPKSAAPAKKTVKKSSTKKPASAKAADDGIVKMDVAANSVVWTLNPKVYPLDVVYQAAFIFIDRAYMMLDQNADGLLFVSLKGKEKLNKGELEALQGEFANELLNQAVRKNLSKNNRRLRELIVAKALFAAARPQELRDIMDKVSRPAPSGDAAPRPWDEATQDEQDELDKLLAEIEQDFADDPMGIAVPWDEKYGDAEKADKDAETDKAPKKK